MWPVFPSESVNLLQHPVFHRFFGVVGPVIEIFGEDFDVLFLHYVVDNGGRDFRLTAQLVSCSKFT